MYYLGAVGTVQLNFVKLQNFIHVNIKIVHGSSSGLITFSDEI